MTPRLALPKELRRDGAVAGGGGENIAEVVQRHLEVEAGASHRVELRTGNVSEAGELFVGDALGPADERRNRAEKLRGMSLTEIGPDVFTGDTETVKASEIGDHEALDRLGRPRRPPAYDADRYRGLLV